MPKLIEKFSDYAKNFFSLHFPEQVWVLTHIFKVGRVREISRLALKIANEHIKDPDLDGDYSGGMVDAFRHTLWMMLLTQEFGEKLARSLGKVHEKGNYIDFRKKKLEEDKLPDAVSCEMDLLNNETGIYLGKKYPNATLDESIEIAKKYVLEGFCWKIKKDSKGNSLDKYNRIIPPGEWHGKWFNDRELVPTDFFVG